MLEIPESHTLAKQLSQTVQGKGIKSVQAGACPHRFAFFYGDPQTYDALLRGRTVEGAQADGGHVELQLSGGLALAFGDGANLRFLEPGQAPPKKHQFLAEFDDGAHLVCTVQMYAGILAYRVGELQNEYYLVAKAKPSPLSQAFDYAYFQRLQEGLGPNVSVKAFLATEQRIPGLGNGCLQDILFRAGIHPKTPLSTLADGDWERLYDSVKSTLSEMTDRGGRNTEKDLFGNVGGYACILSSKTLKFPCPVCGGRIERRAYLGGNIYSCPTCQPIAAQTERERA